MLKISTTILESGESVFFQVQEQIKSFRNKFSELLGDLVLTENLLELIGSPYFSFVEFALITLNINKLCVQCNEI